MYDSCHDHVMTPSATYMRSEKPESALHYTQGRFWSNERELNYVLLTAVGDHGQEYPLLLAR